MITTILVCVISAYESDDYNITGQAVTEYYEADNTPSTTQVIYINK